MLVNLFTGSKGFKDNLDELNAAVAEYNSALDDLTFFTVLDLQRQGRIVLSSLCGIQDRLDSLHSGQSLDESFRNSLGSVSENTKVKS
jgi:hypothetical protein